MRCKGLDSKIREVSWKYINGAWLSAITVCNQSLYSYIPDITLPTIPDVTGLSLSSEGVYVTINWTPSDRYYTEVQVKNDDGEWTTLDLVDIGQTE